RALAAGTDEGDHLADQGIATKFTLDRVDAVGHGAFDKEQRTIGSAHAVHLGARGAAPAQADHVQSDQRAGLAERKAERNDVVGWRRHSGTHHARADPYILVEPDMSAE